MQLYPLIQTKVELEKNIETVEKYLTEGSDDEFQEMVGYIERGTCFVVYQIDKGQLGFVPSKFIGHFSNSIEKHSERRFHGGGETNVKISSILNEKMDENAELESKYIEYCSLLDIKPHSKTRKYWTGLIGIQIQIETENIEFLEGGKREGWHKYRERNPKVISIAKQNFKAKNAGRLFCEACGFDFEKNYGVLGIDFIESHHMRPLSIRKKGELTNPNDIAMLCSNCHRMVHKKRPWIEKKEDLKFLIKH